MTKLAADYRETSLVAADSTQRIAEQLKPIELSVSTERLAEMFRPVDLRRFAESFRHLEEISRAELVATSVRWESL